MRNRDTIKAIIPDGKLAKDTSALRRLHPTGYNLPLTGDNDASFWGPLSTPSIDREEDKETSTAETAAESPRSEKLSPLPPLLPVDFAM